MPIELPELPYPVDALEPFISTPTLHDGAGLKVVTTSRCGHALIGSSPQPTSAGSRNE